LLAIKTFLWIYWNCLEERHNTQRSPLYQMIDIVKLLLLKCTVCLTWIWTVNILLYTVHPFSNADHNALITQSAVLFIYVTKFADLETRNRRCGLIYLMGMCTGNTHESNSWSCTHITNICLFSVENSALCVVLIVWVNFKICYVS
jgi:hypothetical protein